MAALKLLLDDTFEYDFALIAMHCSLEDYRLAFILNKYAGLHLKCAKDVYYYTKNDRYSFPTMQYEDVKNYVNYTLISNKYKFKELDNLSNNDLFAESAGEHFKTFNLVPEVRNADYLLKIESDSEQVCLQTLLNQLNQISQIITAYDVNVSSLKSKQNLIFE